MEIINRIKDKNNLIHVQCLFLSLAIIASPIYSLPKRFQFLGIGGKLSGYFIILGLLFCLAEFLIYRFKIPKSVLHFLGILLLWSIFTEIVGLITYPYYGMINPAGSEKLSALIQFLEAHHFDTIANMGIEAIWIGAQAFKSTFTDFIYTFVVSAWVIHLFSENFNEGFNKIRKYILLLTIALGIYAIPEILLFKFHMELGRNILSVTNPFLYDVGQYLGWYPPLIWSNEQLRSYSTEPSIFGFLAASIIPISWSYFKDKLRWEYCVLYSYFIMLVFMTKSRTANAIAMYNGITLILLFFVSKAKKIILLLLALSFAGFAANIALNYVPDFQILKQSDQPTQVEKTENISGYYNENMKSILEKNSRSNGSRLINIKSHLNVIKEHPFFGVGRNLKEYYVREHLTVDAMSNDEIRSITDTLNEKGPLGPASYGNVNQYIFILANSGIIGLFIYLLPVMYMSYEIIKRHLWRDDKILILYIALVGNLLAQMAGEGTILLYIIGGVLYVGITNYDTIPHKTGSVK